MDRGIITISENGTVIMPTVPVWMTQQERCVQCVRLRHPQGYPCHLQEHGIVGRRNDAACQAGRQDLL